jgi:phosphomannomutase
MGSMYPLVSDLMAEYDVRFGTSGIRGLVDNLTDRLVYGATLGFIDHLRDQNLLREDATMGIGGDLRPSTGRLMDAAARATTDAGLRVDFLGRVPSPAVAQWGISRGLPTVMVTGSHIPADRNGLKYTRPDGEILKADEQAIRARTVEIGDLFEPDGSFRSRARLTAVDETARAEYRDRLIDFFGRGALAGLTVGVYQHSAVGRDDMVAILEALGATAVPLGRSERFVPVDTEAIRPEDVRLASDWSRQHGFDAIVSTDGDSDRPLVADEHGVWLRGDVAGILTASYLGIDAVALPVSCNTAVDSCGRFAKVLRTRIGSPFVIEGMDQLRREGHSQVGGYEANGGFLVATPVALNGRILSPLPTRDAILVQLAILAMAAEQQTTVRALVNQLPPRHTASDRLKEFPTDRSSALLSHLAGGGTTVQAAALGLGPGSVMSFDQTDGLRMQLDSGEIVHLRPSGNAPEFRCYAEAATQDRASALVQATISIMAGWRDGPLPGLRRS